LLSVSGIGPSTARLALSSLTPDDLKHAILSENVAAFKQVKGVGPKTAKRIILDLKDKLLKESGDDPITFTPQDNTIRDEALSALMALGFNRIHVQKALNKILKEQPDVDSVESLIKIALKRLS
jgi:Holliday junction DNA helicase RuvA